MFLLINKPKGITSHDVVNRIRRLVNTYPATPRLRRARIGHAGTLDPNATGLLIVGIGRESTKKLGMLAKDTTKTYIAEIVLGEERETDDVEGNIRNTKYEILNTKQITNSKIQTVLKQFIGQQKQLPPEYSAIKIKGKKAYELARKGKDVKLEARKIVIHSIKLLGYIYPKLEIECEVSSGTYLRALARDIGRKLGTGAYLKNLKRTAIGKYELKDAIKLDKITLENLKSFSFEI
ncbi:tRNA pseudouridine(55) synthase TruB [Candidatus Woesebacteria bacterium]|nr:tRNA pseudouridine(55) synthase TruB [Candidatus Woesebacteria bacterium]